MLSYPFCGIECIVRVGNSRIMKGQGQTSVCCGALMCVFHVSSVVLGL